MSVSVDSAHILERAEKVCRDERSTGVLVSHHSVQYDAAPAICPFLSLSISFGYSFLMNLHVSQINSAPHPLRITASSICIQSANSISSLKTK